MKRIAVLVLAALACAAALGADDPAPLVPNAMPARSCASLKTLAVPNTQVIEAGEVAAKESAPAWCRVTALVSYPSGDRFTVWVGLPLTGWNGRFQGQGGGGFMAGSPESLAPQVARGYAVAATDAGIQRSADSKKPAMADGSFGLDKNGRLAWNLIRDFAHRGMHEMTMTGKTVTQAFYDHAPRRAYFVGCSTGGRQGQMEAQRYPNDYDGILSGAPAVNWTKLHIAQMWGQLQMLETRHVVAPCKMAAASAAAVAACDAADGVKDGVIGLPRQCRYDPKALVGSTPASCGEFTAADANVIGKIWDGARAQDGSFLWYGAQRGADLTALSGANPAGTEQMPFAISLDWWRYFLTEDPNWDWRTLTPVTYEQLWSQSVEQFPVIATDSADLSAFRRHGGKTILWHGEADQLIYPQGTIDYYQRIQQHEGPKSADGFVRLFMAPGVAHCAGGPGPQPARQLDALVQWVEQGKAPESLSAESRDDKGRIVRSRPLCPFPSVAVYLGHGSSDEAGSFKCGAAPKG